MGSNLTSWAAFAAVAAGGALGASGRFAIGLWLQREATELPLATLLANIVGCFLAGFLGIWLTERVILPPLWMVFLLTGVLGGFTTFSAFSLESWRLAAGGMVQTAGANVLLNLLGCLLAVSAGAWIARSLP